MNTPSFQKLITFLAAIPHFSSENSRRAFIHFAGLGSLAPKINFGGTAQDFLSLFLSLLVTHGTLKNNRRALDVFLDSVELQIGEDRKAELRPLRQALSEDDSTLAEYSEEDLDAYLHFIESQCATIDPRRTPRGGQLHDVVLPLTDVFITMKAGQGIPAEREAEHTLLYFDEEKRMKLLPVTNSDATNAEYDFRYHRL